MVFRVIISEKGRDPYGDSLEILGSYDQYRKVLQVKADRVKYWISKGAQMTATINNLFVGQGIVEGKKVTASKVGETSEKRKGQLKSKEDKKKKAEAAAAEPVVEPVAEAEVTPEAAE